MDTYTQQLDPITGKYLTLYLYTDVENTPDLLKKILTGELLCCILKTTLIIDPFQVVVAANKAVLREREKKLITKSLFTEILYSISSSTNISLSLTKFGIHDNDKNILVALIHNEDDKEFLAEQILCHIKGKLTPIEQLSNFNDIVLIKKIYKINEDELKVSSLSDSIVSRIGGDYPVSLK